MFLIPLLVSPPELFTQPPEPSFESQSTLHLARTLLKDHRYLEAVSLLKNRLDTQSPFEDRLPLLLLLADGLVGLGDYTAAQAILKEATSLAEKPDDDRAVEKRWESLDQLTGRPAHNEYATQEDTIIKASRTVSEKPIWPLITNYFFENDLRQVLIDLSDQAGVPILWDATVQGLVTYQAEDEPLEDVLKAILFPAGYTYTYKDGAYYIGSPKPQDPAFGFISQTELVILTNLEASAAINLLSDYFKPYVKAYDTTNMISITAPPALIERIRADLKVFDIPPDQVLIEVIVTEIARVALREMGLDWTVSGVRDNPVWDLTTDHTAIENPTTVWNYTELGVKLGEYTVDLVAALEALVESGDAKIRANPRITTVSGHTAEISMTKDQYFILQTGATQYYQYNVLQAVSTGITLEITPYTSASGEIMVYVKPTVGDVVGKGENDLPEISTRGAKTSVRVMDGETFTIGGLSLQQEKNVKRKIPILGDIPLLGYLFRYDRVETRDTEVVIFVTPHILQM